MPHTREDAEPARQTACIFTGWSRSESLDKGLHLRKQLVEPLEADVLLILAHDAEDDDCALSSCIRPSFSGLESRIVHFESKPMPTTRNLTLTLEALPHWPRVLAAYEAANRTCVRSASWTSDQETPLHATNSSTEILPPYECTPNTPNTLFSPVLGSGRRRAAVLLELHAQHRAMRALEATEAARGGVPYMFVVFSRLEFVFILPHPSWRELVPRDCGLWVPHGEDYNGLNDRHGVMERRHAPIYLGRWDRILSGRILTGRFGIRILGPSEVWLLEILQAANVKICRFASTSFLGCCSNSTAARCFAGGRCVRRQLMSNAAAKAGGRLAAVYGKYPSELELAAQHATALGLEGSRYVSRRTHHGPVLPNLTIVGKPGDVWRPATAAAAEGEAAIWRSDSRYKYALLGLSAANASLPRFMQQISQWSAYAPRNKPGREVSTLIQWHAPDVHIKL